MTNETRALLRFEMLEITRQPRRWAISAVFLLLFGGMFIWRAARDGRNMHDAANDLTMLAIFGSFLANRSWKKHSIGTLAYPFSRPVSRERALIVRMSVLMTIGIVAFGSIGTIALVVQPEPILNTTVKIEGFESLKRFEAAGHVPTFKGKKTRKGYADWPKTDLRQSKQDGFLKGMLSPNLIAVLLGFALYAVFVFNTMHPSMNKPQWRNLRFIGWFAFAMTPFILWFTCIMFNETFISEAVYLNPLLTTACLLVLVLGYASIAVWRWQRADM